MEEYLPVAGSQGGLVWQGVAMLRQKALGAVSQDLQSAKLPPALKVPGPQGLQSLPPWPALQPAGRQQQQRAAAVAAVAGWMAMEQCCWLSTGLHSNRLRI